MNKIFVSKIIEYSPQNQQDNPTTFPLLQAHISVKAVAVCVLGVQWTVQGLLLAVLARPNSPLCAAAPF